MSEITPEQAALAAYQIRTALDTYIKESISPVIDAIKRLNGPLRVIPPEWPQIIIPRIQVPDWLHDLIAASKGDRKAAARLSKMIPATKKAQTEILIDAILDVLRTLRIRCQSTYLVVQD